MDSKLQTIKTIVYILPDKDAGVASVVRNLLRFKSNRYATKVLLIHDKVNDENRRIKDNFNADSTVRITYHGKWASKYSIIRKIQKEIDENSVVISNDGGLGLDAMNHIKHPISVGYILHGNFKHYYNSILKHQNRIRTIVTVSDFLKSKIETVNSEINIQSIKFPVPNAKPFNRIEDESKIRLVFVGSLISDKGIFDIKSILNLLNSKNIPFSLNIIGSGIEEEELKDELKPFETVNFKGKLPNNEVLNLHQKHDIILLPSKAEGLPVVLVEAMKYGVVPIATNLESGIPEIITHGENGYTVSLNAIHKYADYIEHLYLDKQKLKTMSKLCVEKSEQMFNPERQTKLYENVFAESKLLSLRQSLKLRDFLPLTIAHRLKRH